ncbi:EAL domain-containing protein [Deinococcus caeni]|uniref:EAL domain-containing protein n=2 Tax=Deinococcus caeni TaxID=569127 RepID=A0ABP9UEU5_9DEIO
MLEQLPVDSVKIDRSFVQNVDATPRRRSLLRAMLRMGEELGVQVIVEGVETTVERQGLDALGVPFVKRFHRRENSDQNEGPRGRGLKFPGLMGLYAK